MRAPALAASSCGSCGAAEGCMPVALEAEGAEPGTVKEGAALAGPRRASLPPAMTAVEVAPRVTA